MTATKKVYAWPRKPLQKPAATIRPPRRRKDSREYPNTTPGSLYTAGERRMPTTALTTHPTPAVCLSKWYLDLVTEAGEAVVLYWARLHYLGFHGTFASLIHRDASGQIRTSSSLRAGNEPLPAGEITWACAGLGIAAGRWTPVVPPMAHELWRAPGGGSVSWNCIAPAATASLTLNGRELQGVGHVERLDLTVPPWSLPIRELRWGRWISDAAARGHVATPDGDPQSRLRSIVWINWSGDHPLTLIVQDGQLVSGVVRDDAITLHTGALLTLSHDATLREGAIGVTALSFIPGLSRVLPPALLSTHEHKWLCRTRVKELTGESTPRTATGWAIHERVRFGESECSRERDCSNEER